MTERSSRISGLASRFVRVMTLSGLVQTMSPEAALACPACFTATDSPLVTGVSMAILALLGVTLGVLASFGAFFIHLMRRSRRAAKTALAQPVEQGGQS